jgi:hypothetical protein
VKLEKGISGQTGSKPFHKTRMVTGNFVSAKVMNETLKVTAMLSITLVLSTIEVY